MSDGLRRAIVVVLVTATACGARSPSREDVKTTRISRQVANVHAFGRVYGVLRWFHPSDAAAAVDWNRFAVEGVLDRAEMSDIQNMIGELAAARGIVFDLRGYPNSNHDVLSYLLSSPVEISAGMSIPHLIRPFHARASALTWETSNIGFLRSSRTSAGASLSSQVPRRSAMPKP